MILFCPVATKAPVATTAPAIGAVPPQTPNPTIHSPMTATPNKVGPRVDLGISAYQECSPAEAYDMRYVLLGVQERRSVGAAARSVGRRALSGQNRQHVLALAEGLH